MFMTKRELKVTVAPHVRPKRKRKIERKRRRSKREGK